MSAIASTVPAEGHGASNSQTFDRWARSYDTQCNPLLRLEQRVLEPLLPEFSGKDVLDVGCGSGRWLTRLTQRRPRSLYGSDSSAGMLDTARQKHLPGVELVQASCQQTALPDRSFDVVLASFLLSYVDQLGQFATEMTRIARAGCDLFISDMHPDSQMHLGWKRTFRDGKEIVEVSSFVHPIDEVIETFQSRGWVAEVRLDPHFGDAERETFDTSGHSDRFDEACRYPAIYILHLRKTYPVSNQVAGVTLRGGCYAFEPERSQNAFLYVNAGRISQIANDPIILSSPSSITLDLSGYLVLPGFINAHDHLDFALFPRLAGSRYGNASEWAEDIHAKFFDLIAKQLEVPKNVRLWWGGIRNLLAGVTTVCHHNPLTDDLKHKNFPVRVLQDIGWAHSLAFDPDLGVAKAATSAGIAFVVHACEGIDNQARNEIWELDRMGILDENCVLVHGLGLDRAGHDLVRKRGATIVLCPSSNQFLFEVTPNDDLFEGEGRVALGSDSPLTAIGDLLDEARFAINTCNASPQTVYRMITRTPADIFHLSQGQGKIEVTGTADLIAIRDTGAAPSDRLRTLSASDIEFVMIRGNVHLASETIFGRLPTQIGDSLEPLSIDGVVRWVRAPARELLSAAESVLGAGSVKLDGKVLSIPEIKESAHA